MRNDVDESSPLEEMVRRQLVERGIHDPRVLAALRSVRRENFFPAERRKEAYADRAASIGHGQTISQPYMVALMTQCLGLDENQIVLELGTGSGYQTAILARLAREVYTIERVKPLLDAAWEKLMEMDLRNVHFRHGDGTLGWPQAGPFDRILITAAPPQLPGRLLMDQLKEEGLAIVPVGPAEQQTLLEVRRRGPELITRDICPCRFVKLIGREGWEEG